MGDNGLVVIKLRERLVASNDLNSCIDHSKPLFELEDDLKSDIKIQPEAIFDKCLEDAVKEISKETWSKGRWYRWN